MKGNQAIINSSVLEHKDNPIKNNIGDNSVMDVIYVITDEYWKEWRRQMTNSHIPYVTAPGLGEYSMMYGKSKSYLRRLLRKLKWYRVKYADTWQVEGTRAFGLYNTTLKRFRDTWKQVDQIKREVNAKNEIWKQKKIKRYGDKAIL